MRIVLVISLLAIPLAIFSTQNTQLVDVTFFQYRFSPVPLYFVVLVSLSVGVVFTWLIHLVGQLSTLLNLHGKEKAIGLEKKKNVELLARVHKLEVANAELKTRYQPDEVDEKSL